MSILALGLLLTGCLEAPDWFDSCDCGDDVCVEDADGQSCVAIPKSCEAAFEDRCDGEAWDIDCVVDLCGDFLGEYDFAMDCHRNAGAVRRFADCTGVPDTPPPTSPTEL